MGFPWVSRQKNGHLWVTLLGAGQQGRQGRGGCDRHQLRQGQRHPRHGDAAMSRAIAQPAQGTQGLAVAADRWGMSFNFAEFS